MTSAGVKGAVGLVKGLTSLGRTAAKSSLVQSGKAGLKKSLVKSLPGSSINNLVASGFAGTALTDILTGKVAEPWKKANKSGKGSDYADAVAENMFTALDAYPLYGVAGKGAKQLGKYAITKTPLKNAYKINPWAFKPNPKSYYRMGEGREFIDDVLETNKIRAYNKNSYVNQREAGKLSGRKEGDEIFIMVKHFPEADTYWSKGVPLDGRYASKNYGDHMIEASNDIPFIHSVNQRTKQKGFVDSPDVNYNSTHSEGDFVKPRQSYDYDAEGNIKSSLGTPLEYNPELIKLYEQHWLKGYKEVPKQLPGSPNAVNDVQKAGFLNPFAIVDRIIPRPPTPLNYVGVESSWNNVSPLNLIPGYGKKLFNKADKLPVGFRKFGNSLEDVKTSKTLSPKGGGRMGAKQIESEGNWAEPNKVNEAYNGVFEATMNPNIEGSNIKLEKWNKRNGIVGTTKEGDVAIPITDPGLSFNRRLPFSNKYVSIDKQKLIDGKFQLATQLPHVQSLIEKYGLIAGHAIVLGYMMGGKKGAMENLKTVNKYSVDPVIDWSKKQWDSFDKTLNKKKQGGAINDAVYVDLTDDEIQDYIKQGYIVEDVE
jgi:hypothetical protein